MKIKLSVFFLLLLFSAKAQFVDLGQDPAGLRWKQIKTEDFQIIYPDYFEENAQKIANIYAALYRHSNSLAHKPVKISMVIHASGGIANGNVAWAPRKTDLYTMPPQEPSDTWLEHLCVHEFRHVVQIDKVNQGLTKLLYYIFGEEITIAVTGLYLPLWFLEGDAVTFETAVGHIGRGRSPEFLNEMKAQIVEKGIYTYYKATLGSDKDFVPNRYNMGYFMVGNARVNYGNEIWTDALNRIGRRPFSLAPFARSLRKTLAQKRDSLWRDSTFRSLFINADSVKKANTYRDAKRTLYRDNFTELQRIWQKEVIHDSSKFDTVSTHNRTYTHYLYPIRLQDGRLIAYKKGLRETGAFVSIGSDKDKLLTRTGVMDDNRYAINDDRIVWTEYRPDIRWEHGGRNTLVSYDLHRHKYRHHKSRHNRFSPFSVGENWGVVEVNDNNRASLVILDPEMKKELQRIKASKDELFIHPHYDGKKITTVVQGRQGIHLESIDLHSGTREKITVPVWYELDNPVVQDSLLLFRASFNANNSFYARNSRTGHIDNVLNAPYGVRFPSLYTDSLYFSFYTSDGYKPGRIALKDLKNIPLDKEHFRLADSLVRRENWKMSWDNDSIYPTRKYRKLTHLFNFHSWGPLYIDPSRQEITAGIVAYSQNKLSTLSLSAGYILDSDYDHGAWMLNASYKGIWPVFSVDIRSGRYDYYTFNTKAENLHTGTKDTLYLKNRSNYTQGEFTVQLPFNISRKNYNRYITPYARYKIEAIHNNKVRETYLLTKKGDIGYILPVNPSDFRFSTPSNYYQMLEYGLLLGSQTRMTPQEINPRWGQSIQIGYAHTPWKKLDLGHEWWVSGTFYFPGFAVNNSISLYGGYQERPDNRAYGKKILQPRGIHFYGSELTTLRTNYKLPLLFPDQHITSLFYIKRLDGGLFFDMGHEKFRRTEKNYYSYGAELTAGFHFLRLPFPLTMGIRTGYETQTKSMFAEFLFNISFSI